MSSGIYVIISVVHPERHYVGSAVDIQLRWLVHKSELLSSAHHNSRLQNHFDKYGLNDLIFAVLEYCPREELLKQEQKYIDLLNPFFNINRVAGSRLGTRHNYASRYKMQKHAVKHVLQKKRKFGSNRYVK